MSQATTVLMTSSVCALFSRALSAFCSWRCIGRRSVVSVWARWRLLSALAWSATWAIWRASWVASSALGALAACGLCLTNLEHFARGERSAGTPLLIGVCFSLSAVAAWLIFSVF